MTRAVIFDVDGTLVDSVDLHAEAWADADDLRDAGCIALYDDPADLLARYDESPLRPSYRAATRA